MRGSCTCKKCEYQLLRKPLVVHSCHCRNCQQQSGSSHSQNAMIESCFLRHIVGEIKPFLVSTGSKKGQTIYRCRTCMTALWSVYNIIGPIFYYIRVGTLEDPNLCPPDVHIFLKRKVSWFQVPKNTQGFQEMYNRNEVWAPSSLERMQLALGSG